VPGTIVLSSVIFALMHYQYTWYGQCEVGLFALMAGWLRWRSGSLVPPMLLHAIIGVVGMLGTMLDL
jgi:membrane protease YdiL (CAAX protease family)